VGLIRELLHALERLQSGRYWWVWRLVQIIGLVVGIAGAVRAVFLGIDLYYRHLAGFEIRFREPLPLSDYLTAAEAELNEQMASAEINIPVTIRNLGERNITLDKVDAALEIQLYKYFVGPRDVEHWFTYRLSFARDDVKFEDQKNRNDVTRRPTLGSHYEGTLLLGGKRGNFALVKVDPGEQAVFDRLQRKQTSLRAQLEAIEERHRQDVEDRIERTFRGGGFSGWLQSPWYTSRQQLRNNLVVFCERDITVNFSGFLFESPEKILVRDAKEDTNLVRITLRLEMTDTSRRRASAKYHFHARCTFAEDLYLWVKAYPVKRLGYGLGGRWEYR
jgi:hypothetical protein